ncbi:MAG TPA: DUF971 domain-containing protein [Phycisphaerae bacterium]|nr:DUF971 domain-containing protein [Phycisphaerales bacterium]HNO77368.1 DUF971 domain-containing protein [Phycisphaerae bacterium]
MGASDTPTQDSYTATDLKLNRSEGTLTIAWKDGHVTVLNAATLRKACPCATCNENRRKETSQLFNILSSDPGTGPPQLTGAALVGNYAIQLMWADGHNSGIFDFKLLRSMDKGRT